MIEIILFSSFIIISVCMETLVMLFFIKLDLEDKAPFPFIDRFLIRMTENIEVFLEYLCFRLDNIRYGR